MLATTIVATTATVRIDMRRNLLTNRERV